jgi:hypothetical protein
MGKIIMKFYRAGDIPLVPAKTHYPLPDCIEELNENIQIKRPKLPWVQVLANSIRAINYAIEMNPFFIEPIKLSRFIPYSAHYVLDKTKVIFVNRSYEVLSEKGGYLTGDHGSFSHLFADRDDPAICFIAKKAYLKIGTNKKSYFMYDDWTMNRKQAVKIRDILIKAVGME